MKRLLPGLCCALLLSAFGPVPSASAHWFSWLHRHKNSANSNAPAPAPNSKPPKASKTPKGPKAPKAKKPWHHREKAAPSANNGSVVTTPGPRSIGWRHKQPGPAGAGAN
jgi:hypothetical protein